MYLSFFFWPMYFSHTFLNVLQPYILDIEIPGTRPPSPCIHRPQVRDWSPGLPRRTPPGRGTSWRLPKLELGKKRHFSWGEIIMVVIVKWNMASMTLCEITRFMLGFSWWNGVYNMSWLMCLPTIAYFIKDKPGWIYKWWLVWNIQNLLFALNLW